MMVPAELQTLLYSYDEEDLNLFIKKVENIEGRFTCSFTIYVNTYDDQIFQTWLVEAAGYRDAKILFDTAEAVEITDDHPLLWKFTDIQCQLYFEGQCKDHKALFYSLYTAHAQIFGQYKSFDIYLQPFRYTGGLLAAGSKKLMLAYAACLEEHGMGYSIILEYMPTYSDGQRYLPEPLDHKVLLMGGSYIIAREFVFYREG